MRKNVIFDEYISFDKRNLTDIDDLIRLCGCIEMIESYFKIEFSCGDGIYPSDISISEGINLEYDGEVDLGEPPRCTESGKILKTGKDYRFTVYDPWNSIHRGDYFYYLNSKLKHSP
jgi:hypothetical protein